MVGNRSGGKSAPCPVEHLKSRTQAAYFASPEVRVREPRPDQIDGLMK